MKSEIKTVTEDGMEIEQLKPSREDELRVEQLLLGFVRALLDEQQIEKTQEEKK